MRRFFTKGNALLRVIQRHIAVAVVVAAAVLLADHYAVRNAGDLPDFLLVPAAQAQNLLSGLSGALLTVTIFLFSTTMVVLTTYSAQFSPRVIENFLGNRATNQVFGVFFGGSVYCIITLFFIRKTGDADTFLVTGVAMVYVLLSIVFFIVFIQSVTTSIQLQNLLSALSQEATEVVDRFVASRKDTVRTDSYSVRAYQNEYPVLATDNGFFEANDIDLIRSLLKGEAYTIVLYPRLGDFVSVGERIASLHYNDLVLTEAVRAGLGDTLVLAQKRFIDNDYRFAIQKIVDVALKALSASINDPNTAIYCLRYLGVLTGRLGRVDGKYAILSLERESGVKASIVDQDFLFERDLWDLYIPIIHYAREDITVVAAILEALHAALLVSTEGNKSHIRALAGYVFESVSQNFQNPVEQQLLERSMQALR